MKNKAAVIFAIVLAGLCTAIGATFFVGPRSTPPIVAVQTTAPDISKIMIGLQGVLAAYRKIIILFADEKALGPSEREMANQVGQWLFHENRQRIVDIEILLESLTSASNPLRFAALSGILDYVESNADLFDADRLAFRELLRSLQANVARDSSLPAIKIHKRISEDLRSESVV